MRARPRRARLVARILAVVVVVVFTGLGFAMGGTNVGHVGTTGPAGGGGVFGSADRIAIIAFGLVGACVILVFTRPRVEADARGIRGRNLIGSYDLPWEVVRGLRFEPGQSWAILDLQDDDSVAVLAVQSADGERARRAADGIRALLAASRQGGTPTE